MDTAYIIWILPYGIPSCITHRPLPTYQISFKSKKLCGRTDVRTYGRTDGRTDIFPLLILLGRLLAVDLTRRLATANRLSVSITGRPFENFPCILFDHHAKFGCHFSYCVCTCKRCQKSGRFWDPAPWDGSVVDTVETTLLPTCVTISNLLTLGQTILV